MSKINPNIIIFIVGPTAVGKTKLSVELAKCIPLQVISCDSMQVQKQADIMTAKASASETAQVRHHYLDQFEVSQSDDKVARNKSSVAHFVASCNRLVDQIRSEGSVPAIVGGSMNQFERYLIQDILVDNDNDNNNDLGSLSNNDIEREFIQKYSNQSVDELYNHLKKIDQNQSVICSRFDRRKILRAIQIYEQTGKEVSKIHNDQKPKLRHCNSLIIYMHADKDIILERITNRINEMKNLSNCLNEIHEMGLKNNYDDDTQNGINQAIGYKEIWPYTKIYKNKYPETEEEKKLFNDCFDTLILNTLRQAKQQMKQMNKILNTYSDLNKITFKINTNKQNKDETFDDYVSNVKKWIFSIQDTFDNSLDFTKQDLKRNRADFTKYYCETCNVESNGYDAYQIHVKSKKHLRKQIKKNKNKNENVEYNENQVINDNHEVLNDNHEVLNDNHEVLNDNHEQKTNKE